MPTAARPAARACLLLLGALAAGCAADNRTVTGLWDATVVVNDLEIPFQLDIAGAAPELRATFVNGDERAIASTHARFEDGRLVAAFDHYASTLEAQLVDGRLEGRYDRGARGSYPFSAAPHSPPPVVTGTPPSIGGLWHIGGVKSSKGESAWRLIVRQTGADVTAAILRVDGDTGMLAGRFAGDRLVLSHFSGARPLLLELAPRPDGSLGIVRNRQEQLVAIRAEQAGDLPLPTDPDHHSTPRDPSVPFRFSFPDLDGRLVSDGDARFEDKVVIVSITGTWCPNCHDEAPFLSELYRQYRPHGLEIVALSFEEKDQLARPARARAFVAQYGIEYPMLLAGIPDQLEEKVPQIANLNAFPTTIVLGRDGLVRAVHAGFPSPASGSFHEETKEAMRSLVERLLAESN